MPVDRPTFSESWYRVANLRPRLRTSIRTYRQWYRGEMFHVLEDPSAASFGRLSAPAYHFVALLDGKRPVAEVWALCSEEMGDDAPTQNEVIQVLGQLYSSNMLDADLPPDTAAIFERQRKRVQREVSSYLMNLLFMRVPLWDPDRFLNRWVTVVGQIFTPVGFVLWLILMAVGLMFLVNNFSDFLAAAAPRSVLSGDNLITLYLVFAGIKAIHELGHGFACKWFGRRNNSSGEVHTIGIMFMALMPIPYVDASTSWAFRSKWHRFIVAGAGMYVELAVAAVAAIIWAQTPVGGLINAVAFNVIFLASVTTLLFNANPLIRFDGYYMFADLIEVPNLAERSKNYIYYLIKRYIYGVRRPTNPARTLGERPWLVTYGIAAFIYRIFISVTIMLFILDRLFFVGAIMAAGAIFGWVIKPLFGWMHYLLTHNELSRVRWRALTATGLFFGAIFWFVGVMEYPDRARAMGVAEPRQMVTVHARASGFIMSVHPHAEDVNPGDGPLVVSVNPATEAAYEELLAFREEVVIRQRLAEINELAEGQALRQQLNSVDEQLEFLRRQRRDLILHAPFVGQWIAPHIEDFKGAFVDQGTTLGVVATTHDLIIRAVALQDLGPRLVDEAIAYNEGRVEIRVHGRPDLELTGRIVRVLPGRDRLPTPALGQLMGGTVPVAMDDPNGSQTAEHFFEVVIELDDLQAVKLMAGQRVIVRFEMSDQPLIKQWWRNARQLVQRRFRVI